MKRYGVDAVITGDNGKRLGYFIFDRECHSNSYPMWQMIDANMFISLAKTGQIQCIECKSLRPYISFNNEELQVYNLLNCTSDAVKLYKSSFLGLKPTFKDDYIDLVNLKDYIICSVAASERTINGVSVLTAFLYGNMERLSTIVNVMHSHGLIEFRNNNVIFEIRAQLSTWRNVLTQLEGLAHNVVFDYGALQTLNSSGIAKFLSDRYCDDYVEEMIKMMSTHNRSVKW